MVVVTVRERSEVKIQTPAGVITVTFYRKDGKDKLKIDLGGKHWPVIRTSNGMTAKEVRADQEKRILEGKATRREINNATRFGITQAGLDYLARQRQPAKLVQEKVKIESKEVGIGS